MKTAAGDRRGRDHDHRLSPGALPASHVLEGATAAGTRQRFIRLHHQERRRRRLGTTELPLDRGRCTCSVRFTRDPDDITSRGAHRRRRRRLLFTPVGQRASGWMVVAVGLFHATAASKARSARAALSTKSATFRHLQDHDARWKTASVHSHRPGYAVGGAQRRLGVPRAGRRRRSRHDRVVPVRPLLPFRRAGCERLIAAKFHRWAHSGG